MRQSYCVRRDDPDGKYVKTFLDDGNYHIQAIILVNDDGDPVSSSDPLYVIVSGSVEVEQSDHDDLNANANLQVGDADASFSNPVPVQTAAAPASDNNPTLALTYVTGDLTTIAKTVGGTTYTKTLAYVVGDLSTISTWV